MFVIYVEPIIYLLLHNLQDCTFGNSNLEIAWETAAKMNNTYYESQGSHKSATVATSQRRQRQVIHLGWSRINQWQTKNFGRFSPKSETFHILSKLTNPEIRIF